MRLQASTALTAILLCGCTASLAPAFGVKLPDLDPSGRIGRDFTCQGSAKPLTVRLADLPESTASVALVLEDLDAQGGPFAHWVVFNAPATTGWLVPGSLPEGTEQGLNDSGESGYFPPCPPAGTHRYLATVYALDTVLDFEDAPTAADLREALGRHILSQGVAEGRYTFGASVEDDL